MNELSELEAELLEMLLDDGALSLLADAANRIQDTLSTTNLSDAHKERLLHCGIMAEYNSGIGMLHSDLEYREQDAKEGIEADPVSEMIITLTSCFEEPSQLSTSEYAFRDENAFDAIPRAIKELEALTQATHSPFIMSEKSQLLLSLAKAKTSYNTVRVFADKCYGMDV